MVLDYRLLQREYLLQISRAMTSRLDLDVVLRLILRYAVELVQGQAGLIALRHDDGSFRIRASYGLPPELLHLFAPLFTDIPSRADRLDPLQWTVPDLQRKLSLVVHAAGVALRQVVALPMVVEDQLVGVIYIFRLEGGAFSLNDRQVLTAFANQAAIAVQNARLYQQVSEEKRRLDAIIENSADGIMILNPQRRIQVFNRALAAMTGVSAEEAIGKPCYEVLHLSDTREDKDICQKDCPLRFPPKEEQLYVEGDITRGDGSTITVGITYSPLYNDDGQLVNVIANVRDITRFREADEMKSTFISIISHELKTPVSLIKGYASTLRREDAHWDERTVREGLAVIEEEADRLNRLIDNLLDASRLQAGAFKLEYTYVRMDRLAERMVEKFRTQTDKHLFVLDFPEDFPVVPGDEHRLEQVLSNLLSNAIKYSPMGGTIRVIGRADDEYVYVAVSDEGVGIPEDEQELIFDRFYRGKSPATKRTTGAGLGLYLCKAVVEAHGGRIWVESKPGQGATFVFTLPRERSLS
mgnify:CR=1 FL=1